MVEFNVGLLKMDDAILTRINTNDQGTPGILVVQDQSFCIIELPYRDNRRNMSCIPCGVYPCVPIKSKKFGDVWLLQDVPDRDGVLIHCGNFAGDSSLGYQTHSHGCLIMGDKHGQIKIPPKGFQQAVLLSKFAMSRFQLLMGRNPFKLIIEEGW